MKVVRLALKNFKRFGNLELDFTDSFTGEPEPLTLIQGSNGSGKTSILQAIAAMLGVATGKLTSLRDLQWPGYRFDLAGDALAFHLGIGTNLATLMIYLLVTLTGYFLMKEFSSSGLTFPRATSSLG